MTTELQHLRDTVELVRAESHPAVDPRLLAAVIDAEDRHPDDDAGALAAIEVAVRLTLDRGDSR